MTSTSSQRSYGFRVFSACLQNFVNDGHRTLLFTFINQQPSFKPQSISSTKSRPNLLAVSEKKAGCLEFELVVAVVATVLMELFGTC